MRLRLGLIAIGAATVTAALAGPVSGKNACVLVSNTEASRILGAPVRILPGESVASCNIWRGPTPVGIITAYPEPFARYQAFRRSIPRARFTPVPSVHPTAFENGPVPAPIVGTPDVYMIFAYAAGHRLRILAMRPVLNRTQLRRLMRIAVTRA